MGCASSKADKGPTFQYASEEDRKDAAANALQLAAADHLRKKSGKAGKEKTKEAKAEEAARAEKEAEAAALIQKAAAAHLALSEPVKPPGLSIPAAPAGSDIVANVIDTARGLAESVANIFGGAQQPGEVARGEGARPPSLAITGGSTTAAAGDNIFSQALNSARDLIFSTPAAPQGASSAEDLAARLEAEETAKESAADATAKGGQADAPSTSTPAVTTATSTPSPGGAAAAPAAAPVLAAAPAAAVSPPVQVNEPTASSSSVKAAEPEPAVLHPDAYRPSLDDFDPEPEEPPEPKVATGPASGDTVQTL